MDDPYLCEIPKELPCEQIKKCSTLPKGQCVDNCVPGKGVGYSDICVGKGCMCKYSTILSDCPTSDKCAAKRGTCAKFCDPKVSDCSSECGLGDGCICVRPKRKNPNPPDLN